MVVSPWKKRDECAFLKRRIQTVFRKIYVALYSDDHSFLGLVVWLCLESRRAFQTQNQLLGTTRRGESSGWDGKKRPVQNFRRPHLPCSLRLPGAGVEGFDLRVVRAERFRRIVRLGREKSTGSEFSATPFLLSCRNLRSPDPLKLSEVGGWWSRRGKNVTSVHF